MDKDAFLKELGLFADLDSQPDSVLNGNNIIIRFHQYGAPVQLTLDTREGSVIERRDGNEVRHNTYKGLLASPSFGDLRRFTEVQKTLLKTEFPYIEDTAAHLPIIGELATDGTETDTNLLDAIKSWLNNTAPPGSPVRALVIDGPAGIGKTHLIRRLCHDRVMGFSAGSPPPILHVQSRGKQLTSLNDVIAGTLQFLRLRLTYFQVPILVRHGLIQVAIDGFDEMADPNGYNTAWGTLGEFIKDCAGGTLLLAGRDTFIDVETVKNAPIGLNSSVISAVHLRHLRADEAREWLGSQGWDKSKIKDMDNLLEEGSYTLRPFFISEINKKLKNEEECGFFLSFPLRSLIDSILEREAKILARTNTSPEQTDKIKERLSAFFIEVARDMADCESESIDQDNLVLILELVFKDHVPEDVLRSLRHRVQSFPLLEREGNNENRRFPHSQVQDYFLGLAYLSLLATGCERPKSLRRNVIGIDFLDIFHDIASSAFPDDVIRFRDGAIRLLADHGFADRSRQNIAAILLAALPATAKPASKTCLIENIWFGDVLLRGTLPSCRLAHVGISYLDARGADLSQIHFENSSVTSLVADMQTRLPDSFPDPHSLSIDEHGRSRKLPNEDMSKWIEKQKPGQEKARNGTQEHFYNEYLDYFERLCRVIIRQGWIRMAKDDSAGKLLEDDRWPNIRDELDRLKFLEASFTKPASGQNAPFVRIRRARELLTRQTDDPEITQVRKAIINLGSS
ncbi:MAG: hypothetical protein HQL76_11655 [Magnetococcales bacterium]|nr:hypothetical protein [Magnetococcales bacterium]